MGGDDPSGYPGPPAIGDEAATLLGSLERQRATFAGKCVDLPAGGFRVERRRVHGDPGRSAEAPRVRGGHLKPGRREPAYRPPPLVDMIEEYARHTGQADLIRESVDGRVGEDPPGRPYAYEPAQRGRA